MSQLPSNTPSADGQAPLPIAGWYPDPEVPGGQRWWDGSAWSQSTQPYNPYTPTTQPRNPRAVAALVLGLVGMLIGLWGIIPILALIFGIVGLGRSNTLTGQDGRPVGRRASIAGIVLGAIGILYAILIIAVPGAAPHF